MLTTVYGHRQSRSGRIQLNWPLHILKGTQKLTELQNVETTAQTAIKRIFSI
jgi:hypothetical protein